MLLVIVVLSLIKVLYLPNNIHNIRHSSLVTILTKKKKKIHLKNPALKKCFHVNCCS